MTAWSGPFTAFDHDLSILESALQDTDDPAVLFKAAADVYDLWARHGSYGCVRHKADALSMRLMQRANALRRLVWCDEAGVPVEECVECKEARA
jgi:hypothetical protein